jgi:hypothetical protein
MAKAPIDLTGRRFDRLVVIGKTEPTKWGRSRWLCLCECGNHIAKISGVLLSIGAEYGCRQCTARLRGGHTRKHGFSRKERLYEVWKTMHQRCENPRVHMFRWYGAKGIRVCTEWGNYATFREWALAHGYQQGLTIDRIDNDGNYEPTNCRWITRAENTKRRNLRVVK